MIGEPVPAGLRRDLGWQVGQANMRRPESGISFSLDPHRRQNVFP